MGAVRGKGHMHVSSLIINTEAQLRLSQQKRSIGRQEYPLATQSIWHPGNLGDPNQLRLPNFLIDPESLSH